MLAFISKFISQGQNGRIIFCWMILPMFCLLTTCKKEEIAKKEYPRVNTLEVSGINESGATFNANIISGDPSRIKEYGFVWDTSPFPEVDFHDKLVVTGVLTGNKFLGIAHSALKKDAVYYMRAYVKTDNYLVYGRVVSFKSLGSEAPLLSGFSPKTGTWGDTIKVTGKNFRYKMSGIEVKLGDVLATIISGTDTTINLVVPAKKNSEKVNLTVSIEGNNSASSSQFTYLIPKISGVNPLSATYNDTVYIRGINFFRDPASNKVFFNGVQVRLVYASETLLKALVPPELTLSQAKISIAGPVNDIEFGPQFRLNDIVLHSFEPDTAFLSDEIITIKGENFNPLSANNKVTIKGFSASIIETSSRQLKVRLPAAIIPDKIFSVITKADISVTTAQQNAKFNKNLEVFWKSRWTKKRNFPGNGRLMGAGFSVGDKGYFGLGITTYPDLIYYKDFWEYNPLADEWTKKNDFPGKQRIRESVFVLEDEGYVGLGSSDVTIHLESYLNDFYKYTPSADRWTKIADYPGKPRALAASFVKNGMAYVGTGRKKYENYNMPYDEDIYAKDFWSFDPKNQQWTEALSFPTKTAAAVGLTIENRGYIYNIGKIYEFKETSWEYKGSTTNTWYGSEVAFTIGSSGYVMYIFLVEYYSKTNETALIELHYPVNCSFPAVFAINNKAYFVCGERNTGKNDVWEFDPSKP